MINENLLDQDTPCLWLDLDIFEKNVKEIAGFLKTHGKQWRPHFKGIKTPEIARMLINAGAIGITCAKLGEAEIAAQAGITGILIANQVVGETKIRRLVQLAKEHDLIVAVDDLSNARQISEIASQEGVTVGVILELNIGMMRAGIDPGEPALSLAKAVSQLPGIRFRGIMGWEGHCAGVSDLEKKVVEIEKAITALTGTAELIRQAGIPVEIVSCGGSGTFRQSATYPGVTEIQTGGCTMGDLTYQDWGAQTSQALHILVTVTSHVHPERAIVDAGRKTFNAERSMPRCLEYPQYKLTALSSEHGTLEIPAGEDHIKVGDKLNFIPSYGDWTVFLHEEIVGVREGKVTARWPIAAKGKIK